MEFGKKYIFHAYVVNYALNVGDTLV